MMRNNTFCENTSLIMHISQQSYFFLEMSTKHISKFTSERFVLPKHALALLGITLTFPRCFKMYYSIILKMSFTFIFRNIVELIFDFVYVFESARIKCVHPSPARNKVRGYLKYNINASVPPPLNDVIANKIIFNFGLNRL